MNGRGIHGRGDVHEFQAKHSAGKRELADVADQRDVGIVDRDIQIGLVVQTRGLVTGREARLFFLSGVAPLGARRGIKKCGTRGEDRYRGDQPKEPSSYRIPGKIHHIHLNRDLPSPLERWE